MCSTTDPRHTATHMFSGASIQNKSILSPSFAFCFDKENEVYQFAMCQPFTYSRHKLCLERLLAMNHTYVFKETIGLLKLVSEPIN